MTADLVAALERRVSLDGVQPFLTHYHLGASAADDTRVELSARTFANWVDKTVNLMASMGLEDAPVVGVPLLVDHPGHWVGLVWTMAVWQMGGTVLGFPREALRVVDLAVVGPENTHPVPGVETVACSLHPLGLGFPSAPPAVTDYAEVLAQPDVHWTSAADSATLAFRGDGVRMSTNDVRAVAATGGRHVVIGRPHREQPSAPASDPAQLPDTPSAWTVVARALVSPLLGGGSTVIVTADVPDPAEATCDRVRAIAHAEAAVAFPEPA